MAKKTTKKKPSSIKALPIKPKARSFRFGLLVFAVIFLLIGGLIIHFSHAASVCTQIAVPAYFYPDASDPSWNNALAASPAPSIMVMDVTDQGAGDAPDPNWQTAVKAAQAKNVKVVGYIDTVYGGMSQATIQKEVANYKAWYNVTDFFLDETSADTAHLSYYQTAANYIHSAKL